MVMMMMMMMVIVAAVVIIMMMIWSNLISLRLLMFYSYGIRRQPQHQLYTDVPSDSDDDDDGNGDDDDRNVTFVSHISGSSLLTLSTPEMSNSNHDDDDDDDDVNRVSVTQRGEYVILSSLCLYFPHL